MKKCDIIIPIYNAYDCVIACLESVIKHTDLVNNRVILINDCSSDKRIIPLLKKYVRNNKNFIFLNNIENLGFVGTVNKGMKYSNNDVLLLNSDTEVTNKWLENIVKCAYSKDYIATVTPLSNNATLASVPKPFTPNDIPKGYTLDTFGELVRKNSKCYYPEIPTGHGFCLYIKRNIIDEIGYFDQETFGKGYGEENDFCFRCLDHGYQNILCDNVYIFHKESQSFSDSKIQLIENGSKALRKKYPEYVDRLELWGTGAPTQYICDNISYALRDNSSKKMNILYIVHDWNLDNLGGTTMHAFDIIQKLRTIYNFHVLVYEKSNYFLYSYFANSVTKTKLKTIKSFSKLNYYNDDYEQMLEEIVDIYGIGIIHVQHMIGHYFNIANVIKKKKICSMITLHDLYSVCPLITKLYKFNSYCGINPPISKCNECLKFTMELSDNSIVNWRNNWNKYLKCFDLIFVPSQDTKNQICNFYKINPIVCEHGISLDKTKSLLSLSSKQKNYEVAFLGAIGIHKGSAIIKKLIKKRFVGKIRYHLFGIMDESIKASKNFVNHGKYDRDDIKKKLENANIKLICLFSICPESFSYTLSESMACGIPVLCFDIGAISERVKKDHIGWVISKDSTEEEIEKEINNIFSNVDDYKKVIDNINKYKLKTSEEMANNYRLYYDKIKVRPALNDDEIIKNFKRGNEYNSTYSYVNYAWVFDTLKWKLISKLKIPKSIKKIYKKIRGNK